MIDSIVSGISNTLYGVFGYENFKNEIFQDLNPPCFYIRCLEQEQKKYIGTRYLRIHHFVIQYFPSTDDRKGECYNVGEKMLECLEVIPVDDFFLRGAEMRFEVVDGVLHFYVDYNAFVKKPLQKQDAMEILQDAVQVKNESR